MIRAALAPTMLAAALFAAEGAASQEAAPGGGPVVARTAEPVPEAFDELACRRVLTRLRIEIPPWQEARPWFVRLFSFADRPEAPVPDRALCLDLLDRPLVIFGESQGGALDADPFPGEPAG